MNLEYILLLPIFFVWFLDSTLFTEIQDATCSTISRDILPVIFIIPLPHGSSTHPRPLRKQLVACRFSLFSTIFALSTISTTLQSCFLLWASNNRIWASSPVCAPFLVKYFANIFFKCIFESICLRSKYKRSSSLMKPYSWEEQQHAIPASFPDWS